MNKTKMLLLEDDPILGELIRSDLDEMFPMGQIEVVGPAFTVSEAVGLLQAELPDMALLDIELSGDRTAGIRLAQHINQTRPIPLVFLSGLPRNEGFELAKLTAPYSYLTKPYQSQQLADTLELLMVRENQRKAGGTVSASTIPKAIFVSTGYGELTPLPLDKLVLLEADGKIIRAYLQDEERPIVFTSPGLKNFFMDYQRELEGDFFHLSRKHVISLSKIQQVKDNHIRLVRHSPDSKHTYFEIPIPKNGDSRRLLFSRLRGSW
ncbi:response regulator [Lunatimonas lonarensis]|nr:response regulator [Lunatimonas lonarensis]